MVERWISRLGEGRVLRLLEANNQTPRLTCALHHLDRRREVISEIEGAGLRVDPGRLLKTAFAVSGGSPVRTGAFRVGSISIQDEAAQMVPLLLGVQAGDRVLDLCAAPGGKTPALVRASGSKGLVVAADLHAHRLRAMYAQLQRLGLRGAHLVELDATKALPFRADFEGILLDAPCSGTGTLARHPEIRWRLQPEQLAELHRLQTELLMTAIESAVGDSDFFLRKAIGWALRDYARTDPAWVRSFAETHELSPLSRREALKHLSCQPGSPTR